MFITNQFKIKLSFLLMLLVACPGFSQNIVTVAGGGVWPGEGGGAINAVIPLPNYVATSANGDFYISDQSNHSIRKISSAGIITTVAGTGTAGFSGDGSAAISAQLYNPSGIAVDDLGNIFIADAGNYRIRKINSKGVITTVAGTGTLGYSGDGGAATSAQISLTSGLALDKLGNLYIAELGNHCIRKLDNNGIITTVAGMGTLGYGGDGGAATSANLANPSAVAVDGFGNLYIADRNNQRIRKVNSNGIISTFAGTGTAGFSGDGNIATLAQIAMPYGVTVDGANNLYIAAAGNYNIRKVNSNGIISTFAGTGTSGFSGDGGPATAAQFFTPRGVTIDSTGNLYITDYFNNRIRKIDKSGIVTTFAGTGGSSNYGGDGAAAASAVLALPAGLAIDHSDNLYIADANNNRIRKVSTTGIITTVVGTGMQGFSGDGGAANLAQLNSPVDVAVDGLSNLYLADANNNRIRKVSTTGIITTVVGTGTQGFSGDGGVATLAQLRYPSSVFVDHLGNLYITDANNNRIRKVSTTGIITTVAGTGTAGYSGDGGAATSAQIANPTDIFVDHLGNLFIADANNNRIRKVSTAGIITTIAGTGNSGYSGDGGAATSAQLATPTRVAVDTLGNLYIVDANNNCIRKVSNSGIITTVAGIGKRGFSGDGGAATLAQLWFPFGIIFDRLGNLYFADRYNNRIRKIFSCSDTIPSISINNSKTVICEGTPLLISSSNSNYNQWYKDGIVLSGATSSTLQISSSGSYSARYIDSLKGCFSAESNILSITINPSPDPVITFNGSTVLCEGDLQVLNVNSNGSGFTYQWKRDGINIPNANGVSYIVTGGGNYAVQVTNTTTSCFAVSAGVPIVVNPLPPKPTITNNGSNFASNIPIGNQWYLNGNIIPGATAQSYTPNQTGNYSVKVTLNNCSGLMSEPVYYLATSVNDLFESEYIKIGPNPFVSKLSVSFRINDLLFLKTRIVNTLGVVVSNEISIRSGQIVNLSTLPSGLYWLILETPDRKRVFKYSIIK